MFVPLPSIPNASGIILAAGLVLLVYELVHRYGPDVKELFANAPATTTEPSLFAAPQGTAPSPTEAVLTAYRACAAAKIPNACEQLESVLRVVSEATVNRVIRQEKGGAVEPPA